LQHDQKVVKVTSQGEKVLFWSASRSTFSSKFSFEWYQFFVISLFFIFLILLVPYVIYLIDILHLFGQKNIIATLFSSTKDFAHLQYCIWPISLNHLRVIHIPHKMLWVPCLNREDTPLLITHKIFLFYIKICLQ